MLPVFVNQGQRAAVGAEALDNVPQNRILRLPGLVAQPGGLAQPVKLVNLGKRGHLIR